MAIASWDANPAGDNVLGYKIYCGQSSGVYTYPGSPKDVGNVTTATFATNPQGPLYFALTAYNANGESAFSTEVSAVNPTGSMIQFGVK